ncbi:MAG: hypothetical protein KGM97_00060 [Alphaproteobacteria bacterium]|nr:hypothetical protein [Alphaproteobacteria bacterium]MDE2629360.1 hypothetical protein [Alphaproteobacteria bacterium]
MRKHADKPRAKRAPSDGEMRVARLAKRDRTEDGVGAKLPLPLEKLLRDTYVRRACYLR